jgi:hypothetical protein
MNEGVKGYVNDNQEERNSRTERKEENKVVGMKTKPEKIA